MEERQAISLSEMAFDTFSAAARGEGVRTAIEEHHAVLLAISHLPSGLDGIIGMASRYDATTDAAVTAVADAYEEHRAAYHAEVNPDFHVRCVASELRDVFGLPFAVAHHIEVRLNKLRWNTPKAPLPPDVVER